MAIAISEANLKEIYSLSNEEKLDLVDMIIQSMRSAVSKIKVQRAVSEAHHIDDQLCGCLHLPTDFDYERALDETISEKYQLR